MLAVIDGITRDSLEIRVDRKLNPTDVIDRLANLLTSARCPSMVATINRRSSLLRPFGHESRRWERGLLMPVLQTPVERGFIKAFNIRLRAEFIEGEISPMHQHSPRTIRRGADHRIRSLNSSGLL